MNDIRCAHCESLIGPAYLGAMNEVKALCVFCSQNYRLVVEPKIGPDDLDAAVARPPPLYTDYWPPKWERDTGPHPTQRWVPPTGPCDPVPGQYPTLTCKSVEQQLRDFRSESEAHG